MIPNDGVDAGVAKIHPISSRDDDDFRVNGECVASGGGGIGS